MSKQRPYYFDHCGDCVDWCGEDCMPRHRPKDDKKVSKPDKQLTDAEKLQRGIDKARQRTVVHKNQITFD